MAVWQFDLYLIPVDAPPPDTGGEAWDSPAIPWSHVRDVQEALAYYFGPPWMMLDDWLVFGPENGNRVDVQFDDELTASILVRCDIRDEAPQFLTIVAELTHSFDCQFFCADDERLIAANVRN